MIQVVVEFISAISQRFRCYNYRARTIVMPFFFLLGRLASSETAAELEFTFTGSDVLLLIRLRSVTVSVTFVLAFSCARAARPARSKVLSLDLLEQSSRNTFRRNVKVVPEVFDALVREVPIVVAPRKTLVDVTSRLQRLASLDHVKVGHALELRMRLKLEVLLSHHHAILESMK